MSDFPSFQVRTLRGREASLAQFEGQATLIVNTASQCGFTPQYAGLEKLYQKYSTDGLVILGFPCNQFGNQEPGDADTIENTCLLNYGVSFPVFEKVDVKGPHAHPLFVWLTAKLPGLLGSSIKWNFTKFLVGADGTPLRRFAPITAPAKMEDAVRRALRR
jgi:glutathione peroxidase